MILEVRHSTQVSVHHPQSFALHSNVPYTNIQCISAEFTVSYCHNCKKNRYSGNGSPARPDSYILAATSLHLKYFIPTALRDDLRGFSEFHLYSGHTQ